MTVRRDRHIIGAMKIVALLLSLFAASAVALSGCKSCDHDGAGGASSASSSSTVTASVSVSSSSGCGTGGAPALPPCVDPGKCNGSDPGCYDPGPCLAGPSCDVELCGDATSWRCPDDAPDCAAPSDCPGATPITMGGHVVAFCCGAPTCSTSSEDTGDAGAGGSGPGCAVTEADDVTCVALGAPGPMEGGPTPVPYCLTVCMDMSGCVPEPGAAAGHYCCPH